VLGLLEGIAAQIEEQRNTQRDERLAPHFKGLGPVLQPHDFPVTHTHGDNRTVVIDIDELGAR